MYRISSWRSCISISFYVKGRVINLHRTYCWFLSICCISAATLRESHLLDTYERWGYTLTFIPFCHKVFWPDHTYTLLQSLTIHINVIILSTISMVSTNSCKSLNVIHFAFCFTLSLNCLALHYVLLIFVAMSNKFSSTWP